MRTGGGSPLLASNLVEGGSFGRLCLLSLQQVRESSKSNVEDGCETLNRIPHLCELAANWR
jgi:hypothetical protein